MSPPTLKHSPRKAGPDPRPNARKPEGFRLPGSSIPSGFWSPPARNHPLPLSRPDRMGETGAFDWLIPWSEHGWVPWSSLSHPRPGGGARRAPRDTGIPGSLGRRIHSAAPHGCGDARQASNCVPHPSQIDQNDAIHLPDASPTSHGCPGPSIPAVLKDRHHAGGLPGRAANPGPTPARSPS